MARRFPHSPHENPRQLFSEAKDPSVLSSQFWSKLFQYRPLLLLGVLWLALISISAVAYSRLMFSGVPVNSSSGVPSPIQRSSPPPVIRPAPKSEGDSTLSSLQPAEGNLGEIQGDTVNSLEATNPAKGFRWKVLGELASLVGLCALGSFLIAQQAKRPPRPKKKRKVIPKAARRAKPVAKRPPHPKRLAPFAPERDGVVVPGAPTIADGPSTLEGQRVDAPAEAVPPVRRPHGHGGIPYGKRPEMSQDKRPERNPKLHRMPPHGRQPDGQQATASASGIVPAQPETHNPDIVPDHEDHPLDWSEESIAHSLDLRHRRSLSSFM
jgi:hypothetical protein